MTIKRIFGIILLAGAVFGLGNKLLSGAAGYIDDGLVIVFFVMIIGLVMLLGVRQILRS
jgi:hypothetical protein